MIRCRSRRCAFQPFCRRWASSPSGTTILQLIPPKRASAIGSVSMLRTRRTCFSGIRKEIGTTCCFATQDKVWVTGPAGEKWEVYTVLADSDTFGTSLKLLEDTDEGEGGVCCGGTAAAGAGQPAGTASCC